MNKNKLSHYDTEAIIKKWENPVKDVKDLGSFAKEVNKIRVKSLRKILFIYLLEWESMNNPSKYIEGNGCLDAACSFEPKSIQKIFHCGKRASYDYLRFFYILRQIVELNQSAFYKFYAETIRLREDLKETREEPMQEALKDG